MCTYWKNIIIIIIIIIHLEKVCKKNWLKLATFVWDK